MCKLFDTQKIEVTTLTNALVFTRGNKSGLANLLGMNRGTLNTKLHRGDKYFVQVIRDDIGDVATLKWLN